MAQTEIAQQFSALPMATLIGSPLQAACDAQLQLAQATAGFINTVGLHEVSDGVTEARTVEFKYNQMQDDGTTRKMSINVPLLSIIKVPSLSIDTVDITFDMEVKTAEEQKSSTDSSASMEASAKFGFFLAKGSVNLKGSVSSHKENTRKTDTSAKYHVEVHAKDLGTSEGMSRVLDILYAAIKPKDESGDDGKAVENKADNKKNTDK